jgi:hypothetical protein
MAWHRTAVQSSAPRVMAARVFLPPPPVSPVPCALRLARRVSLPPRALARSALGVPHGGDGGGVVCCDHDMADPQMAQWVRRVRLFWQCQNVPGPANAPRTRGRGWQGFGWTPERDMGGCRSLNARAAAGGGKSGALGDAGVLAAGRPVHDEAILRASIGKLLEEQEVVMARTAHTRQRRPDQRLRFTADHLAFLMKEIRFPPEVLRKVVGIDARLRHLGQVAGRRRWVLENNLSFLQTEVGLGLEDLHVSVARYPILLQTSLCLLHTVTYTFPWTRKSLGILSC